MTTIVIIARAFDESDFGYSIWKQRENPCCYWCDSESMTFLEYRGHDEVWSCDDCDMHCEYLFGDYGEYELECTREEYEAYEAEERQRWYLRRRYNGKEPTCITDYWQR